MATPAAMLSRLVGDVFRDVDGIGLDVVDIGFFTELVTDGGQPFINAYWTPIEQADSHNEPERLAGRWAAKEAVMKCLGAGVGAIDPIDIEIATLDSGAPAVALRASAAEVAHRHHVTGCLVSISHEDGWAAAIAVAQRATDSSLSNPFPEGPLQGGALDV